MADFHGIKQALATQVGSISLPIGAVGVIVGTAPDADATKYPLNTPVLTYGKGGELADLDTTDNDLGTLPAHVKGMNEVSAGRLVIIRVEEGADAAATIDNIEGEETGTTRTGLHAIKDVKAVTGSDVDFIIAPGFSQNQTVANIMDTIATRIGALALIDGPNEQLSNVITYRNLFDSIHVEVCYPQVELVSGGTIWFSALRGAIEFYKDNLADGGFSDSASNHPLKNVKKATVLIDHVDGDTNTRAHTCFLNQITTVINEGGIHKTWGNLNSTKTNTRYRYSAWVRVINVGRRIVLTALQPYRDRQTLNVLGQVKGVINQTLRSLQNNGHIAGGACVVDPELNTAESILAGNTFINIEFSNSPINEAMTIKYVSVDDFVSVNV